MAAPSSLGSFGPYQIRERLGVGGMAETALAVRHGPAGFEQQVCLKRILPAFSGDERFRAMFLTEARLAARLRHANIVQVYDFGLQQGSYYLALELIDGMDLRKLLRWMTRQQRRLSTDQVAFIAFELLAALSYAHDVTLNGSKAGLVHRDVTPSNILISRRGEVKLADFGIAKATESTTATGSGSVKGKVPYMSPEQASGAPVDARTDLFALGVVLYELLAGARPFDGKNDTATLLNLARGNYVPIGERVSDVPSVLERVIARLLEHDPEKRFGHADEVVDALTGITPPPSTRRSLGVLVDDSLSSKSRQDLRAPTPGADAAKDSPRSGSKEPSVRDDARPESTMALASRDVPGPSANSTGPSSRQQKVIGLTIGIASALALVVIVRWWWPTESPPSESIYAAGGPGGKTVPAVVSGTYSAAPAASAINRAEEDPGLASTVLPAETDAVEEAVAESPPAPAILRVHVIPWGDVWVDGRRRGRSPVRVRLAAGVHRVQAGRGAPERSRRVSLESGQHRTLRFDVHQSHP